EQPNRGNAQTLASLAQAGAVRRSLAFAEGQTTAGFENVAQGHFRKHAHGQNEPTEDLEGKGATSRVETIGVLEDLHNLARRDNLLQEDESVENAARLAFGQGAFAVRTFVGFFGMLGLLDDVLVGLLVLDLPRRPGLGLLHLRLLRLNLLGLLHRSLLDASILAESNISVGCDLHSGNPSCPKGFFILRSTVSSLTRSTAASRWDTTVVAFMCVLVRQPRLPKNRLPR